MRFLVDRAPQVYRIIGTLEVVGAGWSVVALLQAFIRAPGAVLPWGLVFVVLAAYSVVGLAGLLLLRQKEVGEILSIVAQSMQVLQITAGSIAYRFLAGYQASIYVVGDHLAAYGGLTASVNLWRDSGDPPFALGLNLIPLAVLVLLARLPGVTPSKR